MSVTSAARAASLLLIWCVLALSPAARAAAQEPSCGYPSDRAQVETLDGGVPLLFRHAALEVTEREKLLARRQRVLERDRASDVRCPKTEAYLQRILDRLLRGSALESFAASVPEIALVFQCEGRVPLPVARAGAGKVLIVPKALPRLAESEDAIAAVLAHELAHLTLRHVERLISAAGDGVPSRHAARALKSEHEREADITGLKILVNAGYDPLAAVDHLGAVEVLARQARPGALARARRRGPVHDGAEARMQRMRAQIEGCGYAAAGPRTPVQHAVVVELADLAPPRAVTRRVRLSAR